MTDPRSYLNFSEWPVLVMKAPPGSISDADLRTVMDHFTAEITERGGDFVFVNDLSNSPAITATQRQMLVEEMQRVEQLPNVRQLAVAMVFTSAIMRGMLTAVFWMRKPKHETEIFGSAGEALAWARERIARAQAV